MDTLIFVDVDGVLNVGIKDGDRPALLLCHSNAAWARQRAERAPARAPVTKMLSAAERYPDAICTGDHHCAEALVQRLTAIMRAAGDCTSVVLSSNWRKSRHARRVDRLQHRISSYLGEDFEFDARTEEAQEVCAQDRLRSIGSYVRTHYALQRHEEKFSGELRGLQVLILDDFFVTGIDGWACDGARMQHARDVETYVQSFAPDGADIRVKLLHCYEQWETPEGFRVQAGTGLSETHVEDAKAFFSDRERQRQEAAAPAAARVEMVSPPVAPPKMMVKDLVDQAVAEKLDELKYRHAAASLAMCWAGVLSILPLVCLHL